MSVSRTTARRRSVALLAAGGLLTAGLTAVTAQSAAAPNGPRRLYIVQLDERPIAAYTGGVRGYARTAPRKGVKVDVRSAAAQRYGRFLTRRQDRALARVGGEQVVYRYRVALNGVAVRMSRRAADELRRAPGVTAVTRNRINKMDTQRTPTFLGLDRRGGLWDQTGGRDGDAGPRHPGRHRRLRHLAGEPQLRRRGPPPTQPVPGRLPAGRAVPRHHVQQQGRRREVLQRVLPAAGPASQRVPLAARRQRPRLAHCRHGRRQLPGAGPGRGTRPRPDQRDGARREARDLQGLLERRRGRLRHGRQRRRDRRGGRRRRRRHQLLDQRVAREHLRRPRRERVLQRGECRGLRRCLGRQQRARCVHCRPQQPVGHHRGGGHPRPRRSGLGHARQRQHLPGQVDHGRGRPRAAGELDRGRARRCAGA